MPFSRPFIQATCSIAHDRIVIIPSSHSVQSKSVLSSSCSFSHDDDQKTASWLLSQTQHRPKVAIICGSGLGMLPDALKCQDSFPYSNIPGFPQSTVQGHAGRLVFGELKGKTCVCMQGRFHMYEGHSLCKVSTITFPVRVFKLLGVETLIVTNAAGSLADSYQVGDIMIIKDHINFPGLAGLNPLNGPNDDKFGPRFPPMSGVYGKDLQKIAFDLCKSMDISQIVQEGVYCMVGGPNFETIAEARLLHRLGVDAVGMSTAPEVVVATQCGMRVFGLSLITNKVVKSYDDTESVNHKAVLEVSKLRSQMLQTLVSQMDINNNAV
ncbi:purine nucleoside phosphorylase-like [Salvelinus fontinalis]|uniref:purine nucleoside phosphorylase-like n=1 Tax=Salvelinus fontinalis TaxID=8038 RepID=UPI002485BF76|nr:purine nucleoside phosphorylase-like [Salvelinus fontinalis]